MAPGRRQRLRCRRACSVRSVALAVLVRPASALARGALGVELARRTLWEERRPLAVLVRTAAAFAGKAVAVEHAGTSVGKALGRGASGTGQADHGDDESGDEQFHALLLAAPTKSGCYLHRRSPSRKKCITRPLPTPVSRVAGCAFTLPEPPPDETRPADAGASTRSPGRATEGCPEPGARSAECVPGTPGRSRCASRRCLPSCRTVSRARRRWCSDAPRRARA